MKPPPFDHVPARSLEEALSVLEERGDEAKVLAGGQSLVPLLAFRLAYPDVLVDLNPIDELRYLRLEDGVLKMGAMARHRDVERSGDVMDAFPLVADAVPLIGHVAIRNRGTVGGSIAHADPAAEWPAIALALDAECVATRRGGERVIPARDFFVGQFTTALEPDEILTEIRFHLPPAGAGSAFLELSRRHGDFAVVGVACVVAVSDGRISDARVALAGVAPTAVRAPEAERVLIGAAPDDALLREAAAAVEPVLRPVSDVHASADVRRHLAKVLVRRALGRALDRCSEVGT